MRPPTPSAWSRFPRAPAYSRYAEIYDRIGQRTFGEKIAAATIRYLSERGEAPKTVVDLACGTGAATLAFASAGMDVIGIDRSLEMLNGARCAARAAGRSIEWRRADIRDFAVEPEVDLITCFYDGINYLTDSSDLAATFSSVRHALRPGGAFIFDLNTRSKFAESWNDACLVAVDRDDLFGIYQSWFHPDTGLSPLLLTFFVRTDDGSWERFDEEHIERAYPLDEIGSILTNAGLAIEAVLDYVDRTDRFGSAGSERSQRVVFVARRPATVAESSL